MTKMLKRVIFMEMILIIASVFIFRSLWTLLDTIPVMSNKIVLGVSLVLAILISIFAFDYILRKSK